MTLNYRAYIELFRKPPDSCCQDANF